MKFVVKFLTNIVWLVTFYISLLPGISIADPPNNSYLNASSDIGSSAKSYAGSLTNMNRYNQYGTFERSKLRVASDLLFKHNQCDLAYYLARQSVSGLSYVSSYSWQRIAKAAICAKKWSDAISASWLVVDNATTDTWRHRGLVLLGAALEKRNHYSDAKYALAAYQEALSYGYYDSQIAAKIKTIQNAIAAAKALRIDRTFVQSDAAQPSLCLDFSAGIPTTDKQNYGDFLRFFPQFKAQFRKNAYDEICADGASFGTTYQVQILPGLVSENGDKITKSLSYKLTVKDRKSRLWFGNSHYVLPVEGGVPIYGINAKRAGITIYRVNERNLAQNDIREKFRTNLKDWQAENIRDTYGEQVWQGEADLSFKANQETITNLPLASKMPQEAGVYIVTAVSLKDKETVANKNSYNLAALWLVVSDIGITTYQGADGLTLVTRSLATGNPIEGVKLSLYARNNKPLGHAVSDAKGVAKLPPTVFNGKKGNEALTLTALSPKNDFNFMDISVAPYDLSDRGVAGRKVPGPVDAYLYTERGVYRPGEKVHLAALLRNHQGQALDKLPLTIRLLRPDNKVSLEQVLQPQGAGYSHTLQMAPNARTGNWMVQAYLDPKAKPVGTVDFQVEEIVPPRIEVDVTKASQGPLKLNDIAELTIQARYLFGAPGSDLKASGQLYIVPDPNPFPDFAKYSFKPVDEKRDTSFAYLSSTRTNADGNANFKVSINNAPKVKQPLQAHIKAEVVDIDGRAVNTSHIIPIRRRSEYIGILTPGEDGHVQEGTEAKFNIIAVDVTGKPIAVSNLKYRLLEESTDYHWYLEDNSWRYKSQKRDRKIQQGELSITAIAPATVGIPLTYGWYRLEILNTKDEVIVSDRVEVGWTTDANSLETPDRLIVRSDKASYQPGEMAKLSIQSPFIGPVSVVLATNQVVSVQTFNLTAQQQTLEVPIDASWGAGVYALVTVYRPDQKTAKHGPRRAVGLTWLGLDKQLRQIPIQIVAPNKIQPRQRINVQVQNTQPTPNETVYVTLAAVDEGVLRLTNYQNPNPLDYYFGQRSLEIGMRDLYGRLLDGHLGTKGKIRSGGGDGGPIEPGADKPDAHFKIVSIFSGIVALDANGKAQVPLDIPDFNGKLRLIAVAWSGERVGGTSESLTVRDPVVMLPSVPRFLAVGDQSQANLLVQNMDSASGEYRISWSTSGALMSNVETNDQIVNLAVGDRHSVILPLKAHTIGNGAVNLKLTAPNGEVLKRKIKVGIRAPFLPQRQTVFGRLLPNTNIILGPDLVTGLIPKTVSGLLSVSTNPALDVPGILRQLDLYPYGCLEQVLSRAFPLLHIERLANRWNYQSQVPVKQRLIDAVAKLSEKQLADGSFSLWGNTGSTEPWLSVHAMDFLQQVRAYGVEVPDFMWDRGLKWLQSQIVYPATDTQAIANQTYALYVLARQGEKPIETARYLLDQSAKNLPTGIAAAHLGTALAYMGDLPRATIAFTIAAKLKREYGIHDYGSKLRDLAAFIVLRNEAGQQEGIAQLVETLARELAKNKWLSTQEQAWVARAANAVTAAPAPLMVQLNSNIIPARHSPLVHKALVSELATGMAVQNLGSTPAWYSLAVEGSPETAPPVSSNGLQIQRELFDLNGDPVDLNAIKQGELLVVILTGQTTTKDINHQLLIVDPLPAGLEVENSKLAHARNANDLNWIGKLTDTNYTEALDDRFVAALDLYSNNKFRISYLVRVVTPGHYRAPPPLIEDMYKPYYRGNGATSWITVSPSN